jgi:hypothetical protein
VRAYTKRIEGAPRRDVLPPGLDDRLRHMEAALDAIAVEVERISEGQRFTTKLLAQRGEEARVGAGNVAGNGVNGAGHGASGAGLPNGAAAHGYAASSAPTAPAHAGAMPTGAGGYDAR